MRGTYAGLGTAPVIDHLLKLGITAIELMPVHYFIDDRRLIEKGLRNYWGYNTIGFFAPESRYLATSSINEFKTMVKTMHSAGIEVILDVVYNHTAAANQLGPTLSFRGIDNTVYYRTLADNPRYYMDYTGTGNTLNMRHPHARCRRKERARRLARRARPQAIALHPRQQGLKSIDRSVHFCAANFDTIMDQTDYIVPASIEDAGTLAPPPKA